MSILRLLVLWLLIRCLLLLELTVEVLCLVLDFLFSTLCPTSFAIISNVRRELVALL